MIHLTNQAVLEVVRLTDEAERLVRTGSVSDRAIATVLQQKIKTIREVTGRSSDEMRSQYATALVEDLSEKGISPEQYTRAFHAYIAKGRGRLTEAERRDLEVGTATISYTQGAAGGYFVDIKTELDMKNAMKNIDPLLDDTVCDFVMSDTPAFKPTVLAGMDLSSVTASLVGEAVQQVNAAFPNALAKTLRSNIILKWTSSADIEAMQDIPGILSKYAEAAGTALGRLGGQLCVTGDGSSAEPQGILTALPSRAYVTQNTGKTVLDDWTSMFFSVDRFWRNRPKTGWLMSDSVYQRLRQTTDNSGRPLLRIGEDTETLFSKPVYVTPSLPAVGGSLGLNSVVIFGDLGSFHIRMSKPQIQVSYNSAIADITQGRALLISRARLDSIYLDASSGNSPALTASTVIA